jgi:penicillin-binding protein 2
VKFGARVTFVGLLFTALLGVLFIRLWFVQIAQGQVFAVTADEQIIRIDYFNAPRGDIVDRNGVKLATSTSQLIVVVDRAEILEEDEPEMIQRLAAILGVQAIEIQADLEDAGSGMVARLDDYELSASAAYTILEAGPRLPGVTVEAAPVREYLRGQAMAHVLGHIGLPEAGDLESNPNLLPSSVVGKMGVEREYDQFLQGSEGSAAFRVNATGDILEARDDEPPESGASIHLTLDLATQQVVEEVLFDAVALANRLKAEDEEPTLPAQRAAAVVMDPRTGEVLALASYPSFEPQAFVGGIEKQEFDRLAELFAFNNLAIQGLKPPASTFKAVTYVTAVEENVYPDGVFNAQGQIQCSAELQALELADDASQLVYKNWTYPNDAGPQNLHDAFRESCNIYFWEVALRIWDQFKNSDDEDILQDWAFELGIGRPTQIDLPFEASGILPDRELFDRWSAEQPWRVRPEGWLGGDLMNIAVGQGDILVTPVQMATAYSAMVNGGTVYQPRVVDEVRATDGEVIRAIGPRPIRDADLSPNTTASLLADMASVVSAGTARAAFDGSGVAGRVGGKTGTAQGFEDDEGRNHDSTAWFVGAAPIDNPQYVVVVMVDEGGSGGSVAAPAARAIFQHLLGVPRTVLEPGEETD